MRWAAGVATALRERRRRRARNGTAPDAALGQDPVPWIGSNASSIHFYERVGADVGLTAPPPRHQTSHAVTRAELRPGLRVLVCHRSGHAVDEERYVILSQPFVDRHGSAWVAARADGGDWDGVEFELSLEGMGLEADERGQYEEGTFTVRVTDPESW